MGGGFLALLGCSTQASPSATDGGRDAGPTGDAVGERVDARSLDAGGASDAVASDVAVSDAPAVNDAPAESAADVAVVDGRTADAGSDAAPDAVDAAADQRAETPSDALLVVDVGGGADAAAGVTCMGSCFKLATGLSIPGGIAVDTTNVYLTANNAVLRIPKNGGTATPLATGLSSTTIPLAIDATNAYWTDPEKHTVNAIPLGGGAPVTLATGQHNPWELTVVGGRLFWTNQGGIDDGSVFSLALPDGAPQPLSTPRTGAYALAVDAANVYFTLINGTNDTVYKVPRSGGTTVPLAMAQQRPQSIVVDATNVYWVNYVASGEMTGTVMKLPLAGGTPMAIAEHQYNPGNLVSDGTYLYWTNAALFGTAMGTLMKMPVAGGQPVAVATGLMRPLVPRHRRDERLLDRRGRDLQADSAIARSRDRTTSSLRRRPRQPANPANVSNASRAGARAGAPPPASRLHAHPPVTSPAIRHVARQ